MRSVEANKSQAFVLTKSKTHYRTDDRGKTWRSFEMPMTPALVGRPLSFHSDPKKYGYILYQGASCEGDTPWTTTCHDAVRVSLHHDPTQPLTIRS